MIGSDDDMDEAYLRRLVDYDEALANLSPSAGLGLHSASLVAQDIKEEDAILLRLLQCLRPSHQAHPPRIDFELDLS